MTRCTASGCLHDPTSIPSSCAEANITALDIFTNKKYEDVAPTSHNLAAPFGEFCKLVSASTYPSHLEVNRIAAQSARRLKPGATAAPHHHYHSPTDARVRAVKRSEMQLMDIDDNDVNEDGSIASIMNPETGETVDDLRVPTNDPEYAPMLEALKADNKDILVTVLEAMGIR